MTIILENFRHFGGFAAGMVNTGRTLGPILLTSYVDRIFEIDYTPFYPLKWMIIVACCL